MSLDEAPLSTHPASQAWFSLLLINDPNTALVGSLRPPRQNPLWVALKRPFERQAPAPGEAGEQIPGLRPGRARWLGAGLLLALGLACAVFQSERLTSMRSLARPAPAAQLQASVASALPVADPGPPPPPLATKRLDTSARRATAPQPRAPAPPPRRAPRPSAPRSRRP